MKPATESGTLLVGYVDENGVCHKDFEMRMPSLADVDEALEQAGENAGNARLSRYIWAKCVTRIGAVTEITPELLGGLADVEYNRFSAVERALRKKLMGASKDSASDAS